MEKLFAPQFVTTMTESRGNWEDPYAYEEEFFKSILDGSECILPFYDALSTFPSKYDMQRHNRATTATSDELESMRKQHGIISSDPLIWIPCSTLSRWFDDFWKSDGESVRQIRFDREAKARVEGWHGQFKAYAKIHARALFVYERVTWP